MRDDRERLSDILEAIERIEKYAARGSEAFRADELIQTWMVRQFQIIGEAARVLSDGFRKKHPEIPWRDVIGMRHVLVHEYFDIDHDLVWRVVIDHIPKLKRLVQEMLKEIANENRQKR